ncbi:hypothetical protein [Pelosinus sp. UFO1]|uniref:hypothetical protein n=1 Tax=Pelosinus sp. UFO1 TaxID=484770 RepID=UPI0004D1970A|nr:hypothetical protein [Pelosinus sp. UFO1]AIF51853.1 hypothetical protein UFO1_2306 [Pelosinus sp. UFO1]
MIYSLLDPPNLKHYDDMTKTEAKKHLEWYLSQIPERLELLSNAFEFTGGRKKEKLDYSVESLRILWEWFIPQVITEPKTAAELEKEAKILPGGKPRNLERLSIGTLAIAMDIAIYLAEVFIRTCKNVNWGLAKSRSKNYINYNRPVLLGFMAGKYEDELDPHRILNNLSLKVAFGDDKNPDVLINIYNIWKNKVE